MYDAGIQLFFFGHVFDKVGQDRMGVYAIPLSGSHSRRCKENACTL